VTERMTYEETMAWGAEQYRDVLDALAEVGLDGEFTQTGGMCAALQVTLDGGYYLLFTDQEDTLSWSRVEHEGWYVGLFEPEERRKAAVQSATCLTRWLPPYSRGSRGAGPTRRIRRLAAQDDRPVPSLGRLRTRKRSAEWRTSCVVTFSRRHEPRQPGRRSARVSPTPG